MLCIVVHVQVGDVYIHVHVLHPHVYSSIYIGLKTAAYTLFHQDV